MTISAQTPIVTIPANGATVLFNYNFEVPFQDDGVTPAVRVSVEDSLGAITLLNPSQYAINGVGNPNGGYVTYPLSGPALTVGNSMIIQRVLAYSQGLQFLNNSFLPENIEIMGDRLAMMAQQLSLNTGGGSVTAGVSEFNGRSGNVTLFSSDVAGALGYVPVNQAGDTLTGKLLALPSSTTGAGLNLGQGAAPTVPVNGDIWTTASGLFARLGGTTIGFGTGSVSSVNGQTGAVSLVAADVGALAASSRGAVNGVAPLDSGGKVPSANLPAFHTPVYFIVASQAAMLALSTAVVGDIAIRTDLSNQQFVLTALPYSTLGNWQGLPSAASVTSVNGLTGIVNLRLDQVGGDVSIKRYGAVCDGVTDDTAAWNLAIADINSGTIHSLFVPGLSCVAGSLNNVTKGAMLSGNGNMTSGLVNTSGSGIMLNFTGLAPADRVSIQNMSLLTTQANLGQALRIHYATSNFGMGVTLYNMDIKGKAGAAGGWFRGVEMVNVSTSSIIQVTQVGYTGTAYGVTTYPQYAMQSDWAWYTWAEVGKGSFDVKWVHCTCASFTTFFKGSGNVQGHIWESCAPGFGGNMWSYFASDLTLLPYFEIHNCQCEFFITGAIFDNVSYVVITDSEFFSNNALNNIRQSITITNAQDVTVHDCKFVQDDTLGTSHMIQLGNVTNANVHDNTFYTFKGYGIRFYGTTRNATATNNLFNSPYGSAVVYINESPAPSDQQSNTRRGQVLIGGTDTGDITVAGAVGSGINTTPTSKCTIAMPAEVGDELEFSCYLYATETSGALNNLYARLREITHAPSAPIPFQIMQVAFNRNNITNTAMMPAFGEGFISVQVTARLIARAVDAVYSLDTWCNASATMNIGQFRIRRL